jgi:hypothetical protein
MPAPIGLSLFCVAICDRSDAWTGFANVFSFPSEIADTSKISFELGLHGLTTTIPPPIGRCLCLITSNSSSTCSVSG